MLRRLACLSDPVVGFRSSSAGADKPSETARGDRLRDGYFRQQVKRIADADLADIKTRSGLGEEASGISPSVSRHARLVATAAAHRSARHRHRQGRDGSLHRRETAFSVESRPVRHGESLRSQARQVARAGDSLRLRPRQRTVIDKVSYGSKVNYQHHRPGSPNTATSVSSSTRWSWARFPASITARIARGMWWWQALGYTPAGIECWNAMRALDYLETRKEVDAKPHRRHRTFRRRCDVVVDRGGGRSPAVHRSGRRHRRFVCACRRGRGAAFA